jgi:hypothetical protein
MPKRPEPSTHEDEAAAERLFANIEEQVAPKKQKAASSPPVSVAVVEPPAEPTSIHIVMERRSSPTRGEVQAIVLAEVRQPGWVCCAGFDLATIETKATELVCDMLDLKEKNASLKATPHIAQEWTANAKTFLKKYPRLFLNPYAYDAWYLDGAQPEAFHSSWVVGNDANMQQLTMNDFRAPVGGHQYAFCIDKKGKPCKAVRMGKYMFDGIGLTSDGQLDARPLLASNLLPVADSLEAKKNKASGMYEQPEMRELLLHDFAGRTVLDFAVEAPLQVPGCHGCVVCGRDQLWAVEQYCKRRASTDALLLAYKKVSPAMLEALGIDPNLTRLNLSKLENFETLITVSRQRVGGPLELRTLLSVAHQRSNACPSHAVHTRRF